MRILVIILLMTPVTLLGQNNEFYESARNRMVEDQIIARGISDEATLRAMRKVPRHFFVPASYASEAYSDRPLPIGYSQTISQPFIVAYMTELSKPAKGKKALEIGTGSGYQALKDQLAEGGRLVMPVGNPATVQELILLTKKKGKITEQRLEQVLFVPLKRLR